VNLRERVFKTRPNADIKGSIVRVTSGELFLDRTAVFRWEVYGASGKIVDRGSLDLTRSMLREWMSSDEPVAWIKTNVLNFVNLTEAE
jgi:hypothetical protein